MTKKEYEEINPCRKTLNCAFRHLGYHWNKLVEEIINAHRETFQNIQSKARQLFYKRP